MAPPALLDGTTSLLHPGYCRPESGPTLPALLDGTTLLLHPVYCHSEAGLTLPALLDGTTSLLHPVCCHPECPCRARHARTAGHFVRFAESVTLTAHAIA